MAGWWASSWRAAQTPGRAFIDRLQMVYHVANIGDSRTLAIHPASTTHSQLAAEEQMATGVSPGYVRLIGGDRAHRRHPGRPGPGAGRRIDEGGGVAYSIGLNARDGGQ